MSDNRCTVCKKRAYRVHDSRLWNGWYYGCPMHPEAPWEPIPQDNEKEVE